MLLAAQYFIRVQFEIYAFDKFTEFKFEPDTHMCMLSILVFRSFLFFFFKRVRQRAISLGLGSVVGEIGVAVR